MIFYEVIGRRWQLPLLVAQVGSRCAVVASFFGAVNLVGFGFTQPGHSYCSACVAQARAFVRNVVIRGQLVHHVSGSGFRVWGLGCAPLPCVRVDVSDPSLVPSSHQGEWGEASHNHAEPRAENS